jgi:hypothetical protein
MFGKGTHPIANDVVLAYPNYSTEFEIYTDA